MNRKRKILTVAALVIFGVIIGFHYACFSTHYWRGEAGGINLLGTGWYLLWGVPRDVIIEDIRNAALRAGRVLCRTFLPFRGQKTRLSVAVLANAADSAS